MITRLHSRFAGPDGREYPLRVSQLANGKFIGQVELDGIAVIGLPRLTVRDAQRSACDAAFQHLGW